MATQPRQLHEQIHEGQRRRSCWAGAAVDAADLGPADSVPAGFLRWRDRPGRLGVVEWPVTLLVMAGTYVADRARPTAEADSVVDASPSSAAESSDSPPDSAALPR